MDGLSVTLPDLINLRRYAQQVHYPPTSYLMRQGLHQSTLRGRGMDFSEARNYQAGDEIRHMEWRMTARTGRPHVKVYQEERERPVVILTDFNASMYFGTRVAFKSVIAAQLAALLAWTAAKQGDRVGGFLFSEDTHHEFIPRARQNGVLPFLAGLSRYAERVYQDVNVDQEFRKSQDTSSINHALLRMRRVIKPGSILVLLSDFYQMNEETEQHLNRLRCHNDMLVYHIVDPLELAPPPPGQYAITDGQADLLLDTTLDSVRFGYQFYCEKRINLLQTQLKRLQIQSTQVLPDMDLPTLVRQTFLWRKRG